MVTVTRCSECKYYRGLKDGWLPVCDAFPNGDSPFMLDDSNCAPGYKFERNEEEHDGIKY